MAQEKGGEQPLNKYARFKSNTYQWYGEMKAHGLTQQEMKVLEPILLGSYGICESQEAFMQLVQIPECGGFSLDFADALRKAIAKKNPAAYEELTKEYFQTIREKGLSQNLCNYVWNVLVATSRGYGFNLSHTLAYSLIALQEMNLAYRFPIIYWNCACLISDSGGEDGTTDYNKIATALNKMQKAGINISLVDINHSDYNFIPDEENNVIYMGLKSLAWVGDEVIAATINGRPYESMLDYYNRIHPDKRAMISLIKGGAFDQFNSRYRNMVEFIWMTCEKKSRLTLQNMPGLIRHDLLPQDEKYEIPRKVYEFNRYLKDKCKKGTYYLLDERSVDFLNSIGEEICYNDDLTMDVKGWDKIYQFYMDSFRNWLKENSAEILNQLNESIFMLDWEKYASGTISAWEMESICFYYHEHELINVNNEKYGFVDFNELSEIPVVSEVYRRGGANIPIYKLFHICGTCIGKDKAKSTVYLLTTTGVVTVKLRKEHFAVFDAQISQKGADGKKTVIEKSWFNRGNMIVVQGLRRGDEFVAKKYASKGDNHQLYHIDKINEDGTLELRSERYKGEQSEEI